MTRFRREGHWRTGRYGDQHWVDGHWVDRADWHHASIEDLPQPSFIYRPRLKYENFTRPSSCSRCGATVFFVQHNGGSVFFDELGWPWEKHDCFASMPTTTGVASVSARPPTGRMLKWQQQGWIPITIEKVFQEGAWFVLKCRALEDDRLIRVLLPDDPGDLRRMPAMLNTWSTKGFAALTYLDDDAAPQRIVVGKYSEFCLSDINSVEFPDG